MLKKVIKTNKTIKFKDSQLKKSAKRIEKSV
jgi:hypothetical protein